MSDISSLAAAKTYRAMAPLRTVSAGSATGVEAPAAGDESAVVQPRQERQQLVHRPIALPRLENLIELYGGDVDRAQEHLDTSKWFRDYRRQKLEAGINAADSRIAAAHEALSAGQQPQEAARALADGIRERLGLEIGDLGFSTWPGTVSAEELQATHRGKGTAMWTLMVQTETTRRHGYPGSDEAISDINQTRSDLTATLKAGRVEQLAQVELERLRDALPAGSGEQRAAIDKQIEESRKRLGENRDKLGAYGLEAWLDVTGPNASSVKLPNPPLLPDPGTALDWQNPGERYRTGLGGERIGPGMAVFRDTPGALAEREAEYARRREGLVKLVALRHEEVAEARQRIIDCPPDAPEAYRNHLRVQEEKAAGLLALNQSHLTDFDERAALRKASVRHIDTPQGRHVSMEA